MTIKQDVKEGQYEIKIPKRKPGRPSKKAKQAEMYQQNYFNSVIMENIESIANAYVKKAVEGDTKLILDARQVTTMTVAQKAGLAGNTSITQVNFNVYNGNHPNGNQIVDVQAKPIT